MGWKGSTFGPFLKGQGTRTYLSGVSLLSCERRCVSVCGVDGRVGRMAEQLDDYEREFKDLIETVNKRCTKIPDLKGGTWHAYTHKDARSRTHTHTHTHASNAPAPLPRPSTPLLSRWPFKSTPWPLGRSTPPFVGLATSPFGACLTKRTSCEELCVQGLLWDRQTERHKGSSRLLSSQIG